MTTQLSAYLHFLHNAREAMEFYKTVFGGELTITTFANGGMPIEPEEAERVMHAELTAGAIHFFAADTPAHIEYTPAAGITMSLNGSDDSQLSGYFDKLSQGGSITVPMDTAPWGDKFGMLTDKFGIGWMVNISPDKPA